MTHWILFVSSHKIFSIFFTFMSCILSNTSRLSSLIALLGGEMIKKATEAIPDPSSWQGALTSYLQLKLQEKWKIIITSSSKIILCPHSTKSTKMKQSTGITSLLRKTSHRLQRRQMHYISITRSRIGHLDATPLLEPWNTRGAYGMGDIVWETLLKLRKGGVRPSLRRAA